MKKILLALLLILSLVIYILTIKGVAGNPRPIDFKNNLDQATMPLELSPERGRFALTMSLVENHSFALSKTLSDAAYPDVGYYQGRYYIFFAPGISILAVPLYMLGNYYGYSQVFSFFTSTIFALLNIVAIYMICRQIFKLPTWSSLFGSLVFSFGSTSWSYAVTLYQHQATTFFILSSFYSTWKFKEKSKYSWFHVFWVGAAAGLSLSIDYSNILFVLPGLIYFILSAFKLDITKTNFKISLRAISLLSIIPFSILVGLHAYFNQVNFGSWKRLSGSLVGIKTIEQIGNLNSQENVNKLNAAAARKDPAKFFSEEKFPMGLAILSVSPDRGLFLYSPIFIVGIIGLIISLRRNRNLETGFLLANILVILFLYSSWGDPWGGWAFGPRYLIPALGILSIFIAYGLNYIKNIFFRIITYILFIYSSAIALLGVLTTNAVPPRVEGVYLHIGYNFLYNWLFFKDNHSSSFIYNTFFHSNFSLLQYAAPIYGVIIAAATIFLFVLPQMEKQHGV